MTFKDKIEKVTSKSQSKWIVNARNRKSHPWLREYSSEIARRILVIIKNDKELSQVKLADSLHIRPQQISKIVKGQENLTLETIYKLSKALNYELISFPPYEYTQQKNIEISVSSNPITYQIVYMAPKQMMMDEDKALVAFDVVVAFQLNNINTPSIHD